MIKNYLHILISLFILFLFAAGLSAESRYAAEEEFFAMQEQVVVSASKHEQKISEAPAAISVITNDDIEKYGYKTIGEALNQIPGLYMSTDRSNEYGIIRGIHLGDDNQKRILVLLNGHTLNNAVTMECPLGFEIGVPMSSIARIEVMRGAGSIMYGSNAFFGVINIILKDKQQINSDTARIEMNGGSYNLYDGSAMFHYVQNNLFIATQLRSNRGAPAEAYHNYKWEESSNLLITKEDPLTSSTRNTLLKGTTVDEADFDNLFSIISSYKIGKVEMLGKYTSCKEGMPLADWLQEFEEKDKFERAKSGFVELTYSDKFKDKLNYTVRTYINTYKYRDKLYYHELDADSENITYIEGYRNMGIPNGDIWIDRMESILRGGELKVEGSFLDGKINSISGVEYTHKNVKSDYHTYTLFGEITDYEGLNLDWQERKVSSFALYEEINYKLSDKIKSIMGVRYDKITDFSGELSPRIALIYNYKDNENYKFIFGKAFRAPGYKEYSYDDGDLIVNNDLKPEVIYSTDFIATYIFKKFSLNIDLFYSSFDDLIIKNDAANYDNNQNIFRSQYQNPYTIKNYGIEIGMNGKLNKINYFLNTLFIKSNQEGTMNVYSDSVTVTPVSMDERLFNSPSVSINGGINFDYKLFNYGVIANYISSRKIASAAGLDYDIENYPTEVKSRVLFDLNIRTLKKYKGLGLSVAVKDLFDAQREEPVRNIANIMMTKTEGRKIIGKVTYDF